MVRHTIALVALLTVPAFGLQQAPEDNTAPEPLANAVRVCGAIASVDAETGQFNLSGIPVRVTEDTALRIGGELGEFDDLASEQRVTAYGQMSDGVLMAVSVCVKNGEQACCGRRCGDGGCAGICGKGCGKACGKARGKACGQKCGPGQGKCQGDCQMQCGQRHRGKGGCCAQAGKGRGGNAGAGQGFGWGHRGKGNAGKRGCFGAGGRGMGLGKVAQQTVESAPQ